MTKKRGEKTRETSFQEHTNSAIKNVGKKIVGKSAKKRFLYSHEYRVKKMGEKRETIFPETQEYCDQKMMGK